METKAGLPVLDIKEFGENGHFTGYGSVFGNRDSYGDIVMPGAFKRSLADYRKRKTMPRMFWQHDMHRPIGSWLAMDEDDVGLKVEGRLNMDVQQGREAYALLKAGDIDGLSIGYRVVKADPDEAQDALLLKELRLVEVSVVSLGANDRALVGDVKTIRDGGLPSLPEFERFLREAGGFSKSEAAAIAGNGLASLIRSESGGEQPNGEEFLQQLIAAMQGAPIVDLTGDPD